MPNGFLGEQLCSLATQTLLPKAVVICDNISTAIPRNLFAEILGLIAKRVAAKSKKHEREVCLDDKNFADNWLATGSSNLRTASAANEKASDLKIAAD